MAEETPRPQLAEDEVQPEAEASSDAVEQDLEALLADVTRERDEYLDLARRAKADFENYRKRATQQTADAAKRGKAELARELLPSVDALERALETAASGSDALAQGVSLVRDQLLATLERAGVEAYDPAGERFDPAWHEALSTRPGDGVESGIVLETLDRGYRLDGQVLRPARVVVSE
jgi:molecular chaperone GrpE